jgi:hypothetical protein
MWANADSTVLGTLRCAKPATPATCDMGLDRLPREHARQMLADWREMVERTDQRALGTGAGANAPSVAAREIQRRP